jgi:hypothetical protein
MTGAELTDCWSAAHRGEPGFTWPMYVEDPLRSHPRRGLFERIDSCSFSDSLSSRRNAPARKAPIHATTRASLRNSGCKRVHMRLQDEKMVMRRVLRKL